VRQSGETAVEYTISAELADEMLECAFSRNKTAYCSLVRVLLTCSASAMARAPICLRPLLSRLEFYKRREQTRITTAHISGGKESSFGLLQRPQCRVVPQHAGQGHSAVRPDPADRQAVFRQQT
jgi:hypothetical protein